MKKTVLLTFCLSYALASCGGGGGSSSDDSPPPSNPPDSSRPQLNWVAPTTRTDGSFLDLSELSGYKIYSGPTSTNLELVEDLQDGQATSYDLSNMEPGDYYFGIVAYDVNGLQSPISDRLLKTITE